MRNKQAFLVHNIYEVNLRQYTAEGTFSAFARHLPRLKQMGVDVIWLMPIHPIGQKNRKGSLGSYYSIQDFKGVNPEFGSKEDFMKLVSEIHLHGMRVMMDWVANHASWDNVWTVQAPHFFVRNSDGGFHSPYDWTDVIQIDHAQVAQQEAMIDAMEYWVKEFGIDGFRADLAHLTPLPFWIKARNHLDSINSNLIWLAETEDPAYHSAFDISFTWKWMHAAEKVCKGEAPVSLLGEILKGYEDEFSNDALRLYFTSNHDENSWNGTEFEKYGKHVRSLAAFSFTYKSVPLLYSGQEIPNRDRLAFFERSPLHWPDFPDLENFYSELMSLRKNHPALRENYSGLHVPIKIMNDSIICYFRSSKEGNLCVAMNLSGRVASFYFPDDWPAGHYTNHFSNEPIHLFAGKEISFQSGSFFIWRQ